MSMLEDYVNAICRHFLRYFNYHYTSIFNPLLVKTQDLLITAQTYVQTQLSSS